MLVEGSSLRSISRVTVTSINTVTKLLVDAGRACAEFHDATVCRVRTRRIEVDEAWSFVYAKAKNVEGASKAPPEAGDVWTRIAFDPDTKLIISCLIGGRDKLSARAFAVDVRSRVRTRPQITSDGLDLYVDAIEEAFGADVDYGQILKVYARDPKEEERRYSPPACVTAKKRAISGKPDWEHISTSLVERQNLNLRMGREEVHPADQRVQQEAGEPRPPRRTLPRVLQLGQAAHDHEADAGVAAGLTQELYDIKWLAEMVEAHMPEPMKPGPAKGTKYRPRRKE